MAPLSPIVAHPQSHLAVARLVLYEDKCPQIVSSMPWSLQQLCSVQVPPKHCSLGGLRGHFSLVASDLSMDRS